MLDESRDLIIKHFLTIMKECNVDVLKEVLIRKGVFSSSEIGKIFSSEDARHNKRLFFFNIQKKEQKAFNSLIESLKETNQHDIVKLLTPEVTVRSTCKPYCLPPDIDTTDTLSETVPLHVNKDRQCLNVHVVPSTQFLDTISHNGNIDFYSSRSKHRGRVLIINNYEYADGEKHAYRNGAKVDNTNLHKLFNQMGGWEIYQHNNKTGEEMIDLVIRFAQNTENYKYEICFIIVMGHGEEQLNQTIIYGIDGRHIYVNDIQKHFTNDKCRGFRGKPKIFVFQVCRGHTLDHTTLHTETDSARRPCSEPQEAINTHIRTQEDILIGYATLHGYKAHRDPDLGSWYIELICKNFMNHAYIYSVDTLLQLVDQDLRKRMSKDHTMQTAEHHNRGFKRLYLNPGIYYDNGDIKNFHN